jgi:hypothetical protein
MHPSPLHPDRLPATCLQILLSGLPSPRPILTPAELARYVVLIGKGWTLPQALDRIQAERPTLPFLPEAA